jgi:hypothetical protein
MRASLIDQIKIGGKNEIRNQDKESDTSVKTVDDD